MLSLVNAYINVIYALMNELDQHLSLSEISNANPPPHKKKEVELKDSDSDNTCISNHMMKNGQTSLLPYLHKILTMATIPNHGP